MKNYRLIFIFLTALLVGCNSNRVAEKVIERMLTEELPNQILYLKLPEGNGLKAGDHVNAKDSLIGRVSAVYLTNNGSEAIAQIELFEGIKIPVASEFLIQKGNVLGRRQVNIIYSSEKKYIEHKDTVIASIVPDAIDETMDTMLMDTVKLLEESFGRDDTLGNAFKDAIKSIKQY